MKPRLHTFGSALRRPRPLDALAAALVVIAAAGCAQTADDTQAALFPESWRYADDASPVTASTGMVVTTDEYASDVGVEVLRAGGNAVDAAVAVQFALAVVNPEAGNIGGGGFMVLRTAAGETAMAHKAELDPPPQYRSFYLWVTPQRNSIFARLIGLHRRVAL